MSEFLDVAVKVLEITRKPMRPLEIVEYALEHKLFSDKIAGLTPQQTMKAKMSVDVLRNGHSSRFVRTSPGYYYLHYLLDRSMSVQPLPLKLKPKPKEKVLVFPVNLLDKKGRFQGITANWPKYAKSILKTPNCSYLERLDAEQDYDHKQIISYVIITRKNQLLAFRRGSFNRTEEFLRGSGCIGFGGHVSENDEDFFDMGVTYNARRELSEELNLPRTDRDRLESKKGLEIIGALNDDSTLVGKRHFAFIFKYEVSDDPYWNEPKKGEKSITQLGWIDKNSGINLRHFEYWSQLCLRKYFPDFVSKKPSFHIVKKKPLIPPNVLCVLGQVGSGKSSATKVLVKEYGYYEINSGELMAKLINRPPVPKTDRKIFQQYANLFIDRPDGPRLLAKEIFSEINKSKREKILIDGIRHKKTIEELRKLLGEKKLALLYVYASPDIAYNFYKVREGKNKGVMEFFDLWNAPVEQEVAGLIRISDAVLYNWTGREKYKRALRALMKVVRSK